MNGKSLGSKAIAYKQAPSQSKVIHETLEVNNEKESYVRERTTGKQKQQQDVSGIHE